MKLLLHCAASDTTDYWPMMELTRANREEYCTRWGVDLDLHRYDPLKPLNIQRTQCTIDALRKTEWLWFMGVDTVITNMTIDVRKMITSFGDIDCLASNDVWGLNNDVMFFRNCPQTLKFLEAIIPMLDRMSNQDAMMRLFPTIPGFRVKRICHKLFNAYPHRKDYKDPGYWDPGDFIAHYPGLPNNFRTELMIQQLAQVVR